LPPFDNRCPQKISDDKALSLFNSIAISRGFRNIILREMNLTTKQYYSRLSGLVDADLIRKFEERYLLTLVGKLVYDAQINIGKALSYYWKLKAIESIEMSSPGARITKEELKQLIDALIDNHLSKIFLSRNHYLILEEDQRDQDQHLQGKEDNQNSMP
jgi:hypothetical protein